MCWGLFMLMLMRALTHNTTHVHTDRVHVNMSSINMYVGRERSYKNVT